MIKKILSKAIYGIGFIMIGIFAVPAGIFIGLIYLIWTFTDHLINKLDTQ